MLTGMDGRVSRSLDEHRAAVAAALAPIEPLTVLVGDAAGATLLEPLVADHPLPDAPRAAHDGFAVLAQDVEAAPVSLPLSHDVAFSDRGPRRLLPGTAARVSSGMLLPSGADAVVPLASTDGGAARVEIRERVRAGSGVREVGSDARAGTVLVPAGRRLGGRELALAASLGLSRLAVRPVPRVVVIPTGGELVETAGGLLGVPEATGRLVAVAARSAGTHAVRIPAVDDDRRTLRTAIEDQLVRADLVITTGGLSDGRDDAVVAVLRQLGRVEDVDLAFRPGSRHALAVVGEDLGRHVPVIALPGAPAAAALAFEAYVRPALRRMCGFAEYLRPGVRARLTAGFASPDAAAHAVPVRLGVDGQGSVTATPAGQGGAATLASLGAADGIAWIDARTTEVHPGDLVRCTVWDD
ncbi:molybdopterin molybdotransferase MoeA [Demequina lignilytica]|uniref:Molybdopterin molybdenumtransferase n=1 Tax=Demequina lignilytica TaxID=3051663 RepID=A0AAW7M0Z8_9MICO|nr:MULTISPECIES: gephyrin-like molybdotransferase Glp [unclassified Demequina]MDN4477551.1 molybdopterin molybdotransferase MoeA [Demequina sp. SYSU T00039-1]MDN4483596.1 molybdopterin molybdotransferase MoeA [Demequina sp. SYSU T0a273]MDN4488098.1 molybdopterin molybdotransferase MoeA [Demequina sp. SYSU T00039]MDN4490539.1 molybdopterin molybdotransferase MoeA [Demequina sp. SYSU T00068]